jgi:hypothetical protein
MPTSEASREAAKEKRRDREAQLQKVAMRLVAAGYGSMIAAAIAATNTWAIDDIAKESLIEDAFDVAQAFMEVCEARYAGIGVGGY